MGERVRVDARINCLTRKGAASTNQFCCKRVFQPMNRDNDREKEMKQSARRLQASAFLTWLAPPFAFVVITAFGQSYAQSYDAARDYDEGHSIMEPQADISPQHVALVLAHHGYRLVGPLRYRNDHIVASGVDARGWTAKFIIDPRDGEVVKSWRAEPPFGYDGPSDGTDVSEEPVVPENYGPHMEHPSSEQLGSPQIIGRDRDDPRYATASATPHDIYEETGPDRSRQRVRRTLLQPFTLPVGVDPIMPAPSLAPQARLRSHQKGFDLPGPSAARNSDKGHQRHSIPLLAQAQAKNAGATPTAAALKLRKSPLTTWTTAPTGATTTSRSNAASALGSNPAATAAGLSVKAVTPLNPVEPAQAPVAALSSAALSHGSTHSTPPSQPEKPSNAAITNEAEPKANLNR